MLKTYKIKEYYTVEDGKVYAYRDKIDKSRRQVNGCEARAEIIVKITKLKKCCDKLQKSLKVANKKLNELTIIETQLANAGYCALSVPIFKRTGNGIIINDIEGHPIISHFTHEDDCKFSKELITYNLQTDRYQDSSLCEGCCFFDEECRGRGICCFDADPSTLTLIDPITQLPMSADSVAEYKKKLEEILND